MTNLKSQDFLSFLSNVFFFSEVSESSLKKLTNELIEESFIKNKKIFDKGDVGDSMYIIKTGSVKVHEGNHVFDELKEGECFGEYSN
jgi:formate hydrogenlyase transcriptional activator